MNGEWAGQQGLERAREDWFLIEEKKNVENYAESSETQAVYYIPPWNAQHVYTYMCTYTHMSSQACNL